MRNFSWILKVHYIYSLENMLLAMKDGVGKCRLRENMVWVRDSPKEESPGDGSPAVVKNRGVEGRPDRENVFLVRERECVFFIFFKLGLIYLCIYNDISNEWDSNPCRW